MYSELCGEISVCSDCMLEHANGEISPDRDASQPEPWALLTLGFNVAMGGEHNDDCPNQPEWIGEECRCGDLEFSWASCEGCGSNLGGDRYRFTMYRLSLGEARQLFRETLGLARDVNRPIGERIGFIEYAGEFRAYMRDRFAERNRFANWARVAEIFA